MNNAVLPLKLLTVSRYKIYNVKMLNINTSYIKSIFIEFLKIL